MGKSVMTSSVNASPAATALSHGIKLVQWASPGFGMMVSAEQIVVAARTLTRVHITTKPEAPIATRDTLTFCVKTARSKISMDIFDRPRAM